MEIRRSTLSLVAPRTRPSPVAPVEAKLSPDNARRVRAGIEAAERGDFVDLSDVEMRPYLETGELPERVERCIDEYDSRRRT
jgi:hypothetical protein